MSRAGAPSRRLRRLRGIAICPLVEDLYARSDFVCVLPGWQERPCAVCGRTVSVSASLLPLLSRGWAAVCSHDAGRFKRMLTHRIEPPGVAAERRQLVERFAAIRGVDPAAVGQTLPEELSWLYERGLVARGERP